MTEGTTATRLAELEADNARLRRLLEARNAPGELRHRLRSTLALMRSVIRASTKGKNDVEAYAAHLEDRLDALARAQSAVDQFGEVSLASIVLDELQHYNAMEGDQVTLDGPDVFLQPRAAQVMTLAMHELAVNAVEHGPLINKKSGIDVKWRMEGGGSGTVLSLTWKELGLKQRVEPASGGFGTTVLTEMLRYELHAATELNFEADGIRCIIILPLPEQIGRVAMERR